LGLKLRIAIRDEWAHTSEMSGGRDAMIIVLNNIPYFKEFHQFVVSSLETNEKVTKN
jgi:hypothetical protein